MVLIFALNVEVVTVLKSSEQSMITSRSRFHFSLSRRTLTRAFVLTESFPFPGQQLCSQRNECEEPQLQKSVVKYVKRVVILTQTIVVLVLFSSIYY